MLTAISALLHKHLKRGSSSGGIGRAAAVIAATANGTAADKLAIADAAGLIGAQFATPG